MSNDAILFFREVPKMIWSFMNSFNIPGLGFTPGALIMGIISFDIIIWVIRNIFTFGNEAMSKPANYEPKSPDLSMMRFQQMRNNMGRRR